MKKWIAGTVTAIAGAVGIFIATEGTPPEVQGDLKTALYIAATGGKTNLTLGEAIMVESDLTKEWSGIEKGELTPVGSSVRLTIRTFNITEAQSDSVNANCKCLKVNDDNEPTALISF